MTTNEFNWLKDSYRTLVSYNHNPKIREQIDATFFYQNRSVFFYISNLIRFSSDYYSYYLKYFRNTPDYFSNRKVREAQRDTLPKRLEAFFRDCENNKTESTRLVDVLNDPSLIPSYYTEEQIRRLRQADMMVNPVQKQNAFDSAMREVVNQSKAAEKRRQLAAQNLAARIKKNQSQLATVSGRQALIAGKKFSQGEIDAIIAANLLNRLPTAQSLSTKAGRQAAEQWNRDVYSIARAVLEKKDPSLQFRPLVTQTGQAPTKPLPLTPPLPIPPIHITTTVPVTPTSSPSPTTSPSRNKPSLPLMSFPGIGRANAGATVGRAASVAAKPLFSNPITWVVIGVILFFLLIFNELFLKPGALLPTFEYGSSGTAEAGELVKVTKTGPAAVPNPDSDPQDSFIVYQIRVEYLGPGDAEIEVTDTLPNQTTFISTTVESSAPLTEGVRTVKWTLNLNSNEVKTIGLTLLPTAPNIEVHNVAQAEVKKTNVPNQGPIASGGYSGIGLLPSNLAPPPPNWNTIKNNILSAVNRYPSNIEVYQQASQITGVPWELLAAIHYIEGSSNPNQSLVSGRIIGRQVETDVPISACNKGQNGPGDPIRMGNGCGFDTLLRSAIYAGNHLKGKIGRNITTFQDAVTALTRYNGGGNRNCYLPGDRRNPRTAYQHCPREFEGEDDIYPMSQFDAKHSPMYLVYCGDGTPCPAPQVYQRYGVMTIVRAILER